MADPKKKRKKPTPLGEYLDRRRQELGLTWDEVAARAKLSGFGLRRVRETGRMQDLTARNIERALELPDHDLDRFAPEEELREELREAQLEVLKEAVVPDDAEVEIPRPASPPEIQLLSHLVSDKKYRQFVAVLPPVTMRTIHEEAINLIQKMLEEDDEE